jgi:hypothetical protein
VHEHAASAIIRARRPRIACALDEAGLEEQLARFGRIGRHAVWARRLPTELTVLLDADVDDELIRETLAIERECCPFFALSWNDARRELTIAARDNHAPVLEQITRALAIDPVLA